VHQAKAVRMRTIAEAVAVCQNKRPRFLTFLAKYARITPFVVILILT
jgi:hypothetical protein